MSEDQPVTRRTRPPPYEPPASEVRFVPELTAAPLDLPKRESPDPVIAARRAEAERLCLWLGCVRVLCRRSRHCHGRQALCVLEQEDVRAPLLG